MIAEVELAIAQEAERLQGLIDDNRALVARVRTELERSTQEVARAAGGDLEQHAADHRRALQEVSDRLRIREQELNEQIAREQADVMQRIAASLGEVEQRQVEQLRRTVARGRSPPAM